MITCLNSYFCLLYCILVQFGCWKLVDTSINIWFFCFYALQIPSASLTSFSSRVDWYNGERFNTKPDTNRDKLPSKSWFQSASSGQFETRPIIINCSLPSFDCIFPMFSFQIINIYDHLTIFVQPVCVQNPSSSSHIFHYQFLTAHVTTSPKKILDNSESPADIDTVV